MAKLILNDVGDLTSFTTAAAVINANSLAVETAMENTLSRDGTSPNTMSNNFDMNSNQILNLPAPATVNSPLRLQDLTSFVGGGTISSLPAGGATNAVLAKTSGVDYAVGWTNTPTFTTVNTATVPTTVDTLVARNTTDTLTNKTLTNPTVSTGTFTSPSLVTPTLGAATATTINKVTITAPATTATLTIPNNVVLTGPAVSGTAETLENNETITGVKTFGAAGNVGKLTIAGTTSGTTVLNATAAASGTLTLPAATDTLVGKATTDVLTNKTLNSTGTGNVLQVSGVTVSSGQYPGETTTGSATAGNTGEFISSTVLQGSAVSLTTATPANITSISLTAGDWDVWGSIAIVPSSTVTIYEGWISTTSATIPTFPNNGAITLMQLPFTSATQQIIPVGRERISISGTTTVFLSAAMTFAGTCSSYGFIGARRAR